MSQTIVDIVRTDVCAVYTNWPGCPNVGWGLTFNTATLPDGPHVLAVTAVTADGRSATLTREFPTSNNHPVLYEIVNKLSNKVLDVTGASPNNGTIIQQYDFCGYSQQKWQLVPIDSTYYKIVSQESGKVLDITGVSTSNGAIIQQYTYLGGANQQWQFIPTGNGYFNIVSKLDGKVLDDTGVATTNGSYIQQWDSLGGDNQQWKLAVDGSIPVIEGTTQSVAAQTSNGSVSALSVLSLAGGKATTQSLTELNYAASLYYDPYTAAYLFDNGSLVQSAGAINYGTTPAGGSLSVPIYPWHDYQLQTNHYVVAFVVSESTYYDPFGYSYAPTTDGSGDVVFDQTGVAIYVTAEYIELGTTIADQTYVPQDLVSVVPLSDGDDQIYVPTDGQNEFKITISLRSALARQILGLAVVAEAADLAQGNREDAHPIPAILQVSTDNKCPNCLGINPRARLYTVKDSYGQVWSTATSSPLRIDEILTFVSGNSSKMPLANSAGWTTPGSLVQDQGLLDTYGLGSASPGDFVFETQNYYAHLFNGPASLSLPSLSAYGLGGGNAVPLLVYAPYSPQSVKQGCGYYSTELIELQYGGPVRINGDNGPPNTKNICPGLSH